METTDKGLLAFIVGDFAVSMALIVFSALNKVEKLLFFYTVSSMLMTLFSAAFLFVAVAISFYYQRAMFLF